jgi:hypothetical protein
MFKVSSFSREFYKKILNDLKVMFLGLSSKIRWLKKSLGNPMLSRNQGFVDLLDLTRGPFSPAESAKYYGCMPQKDASHIQ